MLAAKLFTEKTISSVNILVLVFKFRLVHWDSFSSTRETDYLLNTVLDNRHLQFVYKSTGSKEKNILHLAFVSDVSTVIDIDVEKQFGPNDQK